MKSVHIPADVLWLSAEDVGRMLGYGVREIRERVVVREDFPAPMRVDGIGKPRWNAAEVNAWAHAQREKTAGRKRSW